MRFTCRRSASPFVVLAEMHDVIRRTIKIAAVVVAEILVLGAVELERLKHVLAHALRELLLLGQTFDDVEHIVEGGLGMPTDDGQNRGELMIARVGSASLRSGIRKRAGHLDGSQSVLDPSLRLIAGRQMLVDQHSVLALDAHDLAVIVEDVDIAVVSVEADNNFLVLSCIIHKALDGDARASVGFHAGPEHLAMLGAGSELHDRIHVQQQRIVVIRPRDARPVDGGVQSDTDGAVLLHFAGLLVVDEHVAPADEQCRPLGRQGMLEFDLEAFLHFARAVDAIAQDFRRSAVPLSGGQRRFDLLQHGCDSLFDFEEECRGMRNFPYVYYHIYNYLSIRKPAQKGRQREGTSWSKRYTSNPGKTWHGPSRPAR